MKQTIPSHRWMVPAGAVTAWIVGAAVLWLAMSDGGKVAAKSEAAATAARERPPGPGRRDPKGRAKARELASLAEGRRVRAVWTEDGALQGGDAFATGTNLRLVGFGSHDGGHRVILGERRNYSRPLLTPDGGGIVYSDKNVTLVGRKRHFQPTMHVVDWSGRNRRLLGEGFAVDVAKDPETGATWVYALETLTAGNSASLSGTRLVRFPLQAPESRELLWDETPLGIDNLQFGRSGRRFAGLFPWPEAGWADHASGSWHKVGEGGCWVSMAPDDSELVAMFAGSHTRLTVFDIGARKSWRVPLMEAPGVKGFQVYHPRWANHPRFLAITGPYPPPRTTDPPAGPTPIHNSGHHADVFIGKFSPSLDRVEGWVRLSKNRVGDFYPDVWVEGGDDVSLTRFPQHDGRRPANPGRPNGAARPGPLDEAPSSAAIGSPRPKSTRTLNPALLAATSRRSDIAPAKNPAFSFFR